MCFQVQISVCWGKKILALISCSVLNNMQPVPLVSKLKATSLCVCFLTGLAGGLNKQIWHVKRVSNVARSLHERPSTKRPDHCCTYKVRLLSSNILQHLMV